MARIKIELPEKYIYSTKIEVRIGDINYGGHLANDAVLTLAHEARIRFLAIHAYTETNVHGLGLIMTDAAVVYKSEAFYGDRLHIDIAILEINRLGFELFYRFSNAVTAKEVAHVKTGMAFFDYTNRKIMATPQEFQKKFLV